MSDLTESRVRELRALAEKATPGPWATEPLNSEHLHDIILDYQVPGQGHPNLIASVYGGEDNHDFPPLRQVDANAKLIAAQSPDMTLALCDSWLAMRAALEEIEQIGHNPADLASDLIGKSDRYSLLTERLAGIARAALTGGRS